LSVLTTCRSRITPEYLQTLAARFNIRIAPGDDEAAYLKLLQSSEAIYDHLETVDDYIHPDLVPTPTTSAREFWRPLLIDNALNAWSHRANFKALQPSNDLLSGRTVVFKDNICVGGMPTGLGTDPNLLSREGSYPISPIDATVVSRVLDAGGIVAGTATCETYSASTQSSTSIRGRIENAWGQGYSAGGSSSGCGALLGANVVSKATNTSFGDGADMAVGGDQGGSIRLPAAYNGCFGFKPTFGLVPYTGVSGLSPMLDHAGPMANSLEDIARLLKVLAGYDGMDARMTPESPLRQDVPDYVASLAESFAECESRHPPTFTVGLLSEAFCMPGMDPVVSDLVYQSAKRSFERMGVRVVDVSVPSHTAGPLLWTAATRVSMADCCVAAQTPGYLSYPAPHLDLKWPPDQSMYETLKATNPLIMNLVFSGAFLKDKYGPAAEAKAHRKVFQLRQAYDHALKAADVLITPTTIGLATKHPELTRDGKVTGIMERVEPSVGLTSNTCGFNITGHPALSVPCGFGTDGETGQVLPVGMQIVGRRWDENMVLKAAAFFQVGQERLKLAESVVHQAHL
jgi:amidase